jgi:hypothetical protein
MARLLGGDPNGDFGLLSLEENGSDPIPVVDVTPSGPLAPCSWPVAGACAGLDEHPLADYIREAAVTYLWNWTGKVFGTCEVTVRPCRAGCDSESTYRGVAGSPSLLPTVGGLWEPVLVAGVWRNLSCGLCKGDRCSCDEVASVRLPHPVSAVSSVVIDGVELDAGAYRVDNHALLVRDDGGQWPACQNMGLPDGEPGTWSVTFTWGWPVPAHGQLAAGVLACELGKARVNDDSCLLPQRLQTVTREGVTVAVMDPFDGLEDGKTGIWLIDSWVDSIRKPPARSAVYSPDRRQGGRVTTFRGVAGP